MLILNQLTGKVVSGRLYVEAICHAHEQVHSGNFYTVSHIFNNVANSNSAELLIQVGLTLTNHTVFDIACGGDAEFHIFEGPTFSSSGTSVSAVQNNRASTNTSGSTLSHTPTISDAGTTLYETFVPGGGIFGAGGSDGGPIRSGTELILATGTAYLLRVTNTSGGTQDISIGLGYYEV